MYILQNALKNIARNKGRNIMVGSIIFAIILTTVVALIINNTADAVIEDYKNRFGSEVFLQPDYERLREDAMSTSAEGGRMTMRMPSLSSELYLQIADSEYLQKSVLTGNVSANSDDIRAIDQSDEEETEEPEDETGIGGQMGMGGMAVMRFVGGGNFNLMGDSWEEFGDGSRTLDSGAFPENDNECIISTDLAEENGIAIGDVITFTASVGREIPEDTDTSAWQDGDVVTINGVEYTVSIFNEDMISVSRDAPVELTVTGLYLDLNDEYTNENLSGIASLNRRNEILTTLPTLLATRYSDETTLQVNATYYLSDPSLLEAFEAEARSKGLPDTFTVTTDASSYDSIVKPVLSLKSISLTFMLVVLVLGGIILLLLASISIRERKYEIGVLRAMGMKKSQVALGLLSEMLAITCACLVLGLCIGSIAAQPVSDILLEQQVAAAESNTGNGQFPGGNMGGGMMMGGGNRGGGGFQSMTSSLGGSVMFGRGTTAEPLSEMTITLSFVTVLEIIGISILLALAAGFMSVSKITKYEPIKILMERN